jgi:hypothetical protein
MAKTKKPKTKDQRVMGAIPTNWIDPLLSGPDGIGQPPYDCRDIEKLLRGVQDRVRLALRVPHA